jgi:hypothetical protein
VAAPLIGVAAWIYDGIFIGAMLTGDMLRAMLLSVASMRWRWCFWCRPMATTGFGPG